MRIGLLPKINMRGFTMVELMIASAVFGVVLLICMAGVVQIGRMYHKGVTTAKVQEATRGAVDEIVQELQFNKGMFNPAETAGLTRQVCVGSKMFEATINRKIPNDTSNPTPGNSALRRGGDGGSCTSLSTTADSRELLGPNMRVLAFDVNCSDRLCSVHLRVGYGDDDAMEDSSGATNLSSMAATQLATVRCRNNSGAFCAVSDIQTTVLRRLTLN